MGLQPGLSKSFWTRAKPTYSNWNNKHKFLCALGPKHCEKIRHHTCGCCLIKVLTESSLCFQTWKLGFFSFFLISFFYHVFSALSVNKRTNVLVQVCLSWWNKRQQPRTALTARSATTPESQPRRVPTPQYPDPVRSTCPKSQPWDPTGDFLFSGPWGSRHPLTSRLSCRWPKRKEASNKLSELPSLPASAPSAFPSPPEIRFLKGQ